MSDVIRVGFKKDNDPIEMLFTVQHTDGTIFAIYSDANDDGLYLCTDVERVEDGGGECHYLLDGDGDIRLCDDTDGYVKRRIIDSLPKEIKEEGNEKMNINHIFRELTDELERAEKLHPFTVLEK